MKDPKGVCVVSTDVESGAILGERTIRNDYCIVTHGAVYVDGIQRYGNGTTVLTLKRRPAHALEPATPEAMAERVWEWDLTEVVGCGVPLSGPGEVSSLPLPGMRPGGGTAGAHDRDREEEGPMKGMTDTERLDLLDRLGTEVAYGTGVILRRSETGRGWRLHQTSREGASPTVLEAIDRFALGYQPPGEPGKEG